MKKNTFLSNFYALGLLVIVGLVVLAGSNIIISSLDNLEFESLREHVGETEEVNLNVYFVGFPGSIKSELEDAIQETLDSKTIYDTKDWWIPRMAKFDSDFALKNVSGTIPSELIPPDGKIRYDDKSMFQDPSTGAWLPTKLLDPVNGVDIDESVKNWQENNDIVYYSQNEGSYLNEDKSYTDPLRNVQWKVNELKVNVFPPSQLSDLYTKLKATKRTFTSSNPNKTYTLYSYSDLMDWIEESSNIKEVQGGATIVFLNLEDFKSQNYSFYADPSKDKVPLPGFVPVEVQYPYNLGTANPPTNSNQQVANLMTSVLGGGLTQAKMYAALETVCKLQTTASQAGVNPPGMKSTQRICAEWDLVPIKNFAGNNDRRFFVSDFTSEYASYSSGGSSQSLITSVNKNISEIFRYGVLPPSVRGSHPYSEAYELRTLVADLRLNQQEICILNSIDPACLSDPTANYTDENGNEQPCGPAILAAQTQCSDSSYYQNFPTEQTYELTDVFDVNLALASLNEFSPAEWTANFVPAPFGIVPQVNANGTITGYIYDPYAAAAVKMYLRTFLNEPTLPNPNNPAELVTVTHAPLYRTLTVKDENNNDVQITSSWEKSIDYAVSDITIKDPSLGLYDLVWPDVNLSGTRPFHETGKANVKPLVLYLTPAPDGPLGEKWGTFTNNMYLYAANGNFTAYGAGSWWVSVCGFEEIALSFRDFFQFIPQYALGKDKQAGDLLIHSVMPDGSVEQFSLPWNDKGLFGGAPHWCNEFNDSDIAKKTACRNFVKTTTSLQAVETLQHALGYLHSPEPRVRYHFDGDTSSLTRMYELLADPTDTVGYLLHNFVNQYTTVGLSNLWGQITSEWNAFGPHTGMKASLLRGSLREEMKSAEENLQYAINKFKSGGLSDTIKLRVARLLGIAVGTQKVVLVLYDDWKYQEGLELAKAILSYTDQALTLMGEPNKIYDPLVELGSPTALSGKLVLPKLDKVKTISKNALKSMLNKKDFVNSLSKSSSASK